MKIVGVSDTHGRTLKPSMIPDGDVVIHAGDISRRGNYMEELASLDTFLTKLPHKRAIVIAGNHDRQFIIDNQEARAQFKHAIYLQDESIIIDGLKFYGSPWQPFFFSMAFNLDPDEIKKKWALIPDDTDILITHGPAFGVLDKNKEGIHCGCPELLKALDRVKPRIHIFGHIHDGHGQTVHVTQSGHEIISINAAMRKKDYPHGTIAITVDTA